MSLVLLTYLALAVLVSFSIYIVLRSHQKNRSIQDYAVGNVNFSPAFVGLSLAASMTSAATFIINPGLIATYGWSAFVSYGLVLPIAALLSLFFLTKGFRRFGQMQKALTMAQWMGQRFNHQAFTWYFAFLALLLISFIVLICVGLTQILAQALDANPYLVLAAVIVFIFSYMMFGGANAMVKTNTFQALLMLVVAFILIFSKAELLFSTGENNLFTQLKNIDPQLVSWYHPTSFLFRDFFEIFICQTVIGIAIVCQPHIITKSLLLKDDKSVNQYLLTGITAQSIFFLVVIAGLYARITFPDLSLNGTSLPTDGIMSAYVVNHFPPLVSLLLVLGLLAAGLSTLEGLIQSMSSSLSADIMRKIPVFDRFSDLQLIRLAIVFLAVISFILSVQQIRSPNLSVAIFAQNGVYAYFSAAIVPVLMGLFLKERYFWAPFLASITALVTHFGVYYLRITPYMNLAVRNPAVSATLGIVAALIVAMLIYFWERKRIPLAK
jgi:sodium/pantothenate symporter